MRLHKTVVIDKPRDAVFAYLSDFTTTTEWDPGTVVTVNQHGDGGVGTTYLNTSTFLGRTTQLTYVVTEFIPGERIRLRGENKTVIAVDTMTFRSVDAGTEVTYTAEFTFKGPSRLLARLLRPAFERLGEQAQTGMREALNQLSPARSGRTQAGAEPRGLRMRTLPGGHNGISARARHGASADRLGLRQIPDSA